MNEIFRNNVSKCTYSLPFNFSFIVHFGISIHYTDYNKLKILFFFFFYNIVAFRSLARFTSAHSRLLLLSCTIRRGNRNWLFVVSRVISRIRFITDAACCIRTREIRVVVLRDAATSSFRGLRQFSVHPLKWRGKWP